MKKNYFLNSIYIFLIAAFSFTSCQEKEEDVTPEETCDTMATVQNIPGIGMQLVLENKQVLVPTNAKGVAGTGEVTEFEIDGFKVKAGEQIIIGYKVADATIIQGTNAKVVKVNCVVGIQQKK